MHSNVTVKLMDRDSLPWEGDDVMNWTLTNDDGNFKLEGCAGDFGSWNDPDLFLLIKHRCPEPGHTISIPHRFKEVELKPLYLPETIYIESIRIDESDDKR